MAAGAAVRTNAPVFRLPARHVAQRPALDRAFETWRASIWAAAAIGTAALVTTALQAIAGPADEIVMASAYTLTGTLGHLAPLPK